MFKKIDGYIIKRYLATFFVMLLLFIPIGIMVDVAEKDKKAALAAAEKAAADHGFSLAEITGMAPRKGKTGSKTSAPAKYRNPADTTQTWTGKGRQPAWFKDALSNGTSPEAMEI